MRRTTLPGRRSRWPASCSPPAPPTRRPRSPPSRSGSRPSRSPPGASSRRTPSGRRTPEAEADAADPGPPKQRKPRAETATATRRRPPRRPWTTTRRLGTAGRLRRPRGNSGKGGGGDDSAGRQRCGGPGAQSPYRCGSNEKVTRPAGERLRATAPAVGAASASRGAAHALVRRAVARQLQRRATGAATPTEGLAARATAWPSRRTPPRAAGTGTASVVASASAPPPEPPIAAPAPQARLAEAEAERRVDPVRLGALRDERHRGRPEQPEQGRRRPRARAPRGRSRRGPGAARARARPPARPIRRRPDRAAAVGEPAGDGRHHALERDRDEEHGADRHRARAEVVQAQRDEHVEDAEARAPAGPSATCPRRICRSRDRGPQRGERRPWRRRRRPAARRPRPISRDGQREEGAEDEPVPNSSASGADRRTAERAGDGRADRRSRSPRRGARAARPPPPRRGRRPRSRPEPTPCRKRAAISSARARHEPEREARERRASASATTDRPLGPDARRQPRRRQRERERPERVGGRQHAGLALASGRTRRRGRAAAA